MSSFLCGWLLKYDVRTNNVHRTCADAGMVAKVLKTVHPRLVDMHNYPPYQNSRLKLANWQVLNRKVLRRVGLKQPAQIIERLAAGDPETVTSFMQDVMQYVENLHMKKDGDSVSLPKKVKFEKMAEEDAEVEILMFTIEKQLPYETVEVPHKMVTYKRYVALKEKRKRQRIISAANRKDIKRLEAALKENKDAVDEAEVALQKTYAMIDETLLKKDPIIAKSRPYEEDYSFRN